jgi:stage V sporulation protein B
MLQTSLSQILEQIFNAGISLLAAHLLMRAVANQDTTTRAIYGATGSALGTGSGVLIALIFMWLIYLLNRPSIQKRVDRDRTKEVLSYGQVFGIIIGMVTPVILSTFIYNLNTVSNLKFYQELMQIFKGYSEVQATTNYGLYSGKAMQIINIPVAIASSMSAAIIPTIARTYEVHAREETNYKIAQAIIVTMLISIPCECIKILFNRHFVTKPFC